MAAAKKKILSDFNTLVQDAPFEGIAFYFEDDNICDWKVEFSELQNTPYEQGIFKVRILFPTDYTFKPPQIIFLTKIFHPNIDPVTGKFCSEWQNDWSPAIDIKQLLLYIQTVLNSPILIDNFKNEKQDISCCDFFKTPSLLQIQHLYHTNRELFYEIAKIWTMEYAINI